MEAFIQNRNPDVFAHIYKRHYTTLSKYVAWLTNDVELGKDITQNIFLKIYNRPEIFDASRNLKVWLFTIAKNQWKNELRNRAIRLKHQVFLSSKWANEVKESEQEEKEIRLKRLNNAVVNLSETHKEVFVLKYSNNLTIKEISEVVNCSEGTVKSRLFYALKHLRAAVAT